MPKWLSCKEYTPLFSFPPFFFIILCFENFKFKSLPMCNRMLIFFSWFYESMHTGFQLMDRISSHLMMRFMIVLILWVCKRIFSEAFMHMVDQSCFNIIFFLGFLLWCMIAWNLLLPWSINGLCMEFFSLWLSAFINLRCGLPLKVIVTCICPISGSLKFCILICFRENFFSSVCFALLMSVPSIERWIILRVGFEKPSAIQQRGIVPFCKGLDVIQQAQSGTGKTATFCSGILQQLDYGLVECQALVLAPTRELAQQIEKVMRALGDYLGVKVHACVGGTSVREDQRILSSGVHVVVGTPGRVFDMLRRQSLRPDYIKMFVLDEADEMLSRGFKDQVILKP